MRLCADSSLGEDVSQDVLIAGLRAGPREPGARRAWLAGAVRRRISMVRRSRGRRAAHEADASLERGELVDCDAEPSRVVERFEAHRIVADAVHGLREPYRSAILQRYFEDRTPTEIAALQGVPVATIKTQLTRGTRQLKEELERTFGSHHAYIGALLPLARLFAERALPAGSAPLDPVAPVAAVAGSGPAGVIPLAAAGLILTAGVAALTWATLHPWSAGEVELSSAVAVSGASAEGARGPNSIYVPIPGTGKRETVLLRDPATDAEELPAPGVASSSSSTGEAARDFQATLALLKVRVVDAAGGAISGVVLERRTASNRAGDWQQLGRSDASGELVVEVPMESARIQIDAPGLATVMAGTVLDTGREQSTLVVASRSSTIVGCVVDTKGQSVALARVVYRARADLRQLQDDVLASATSPRWETETDRSGAFSLSGVPVLPGAVLIASHPDHGRTEEAVQDVGSDYRTLVLAQEPEQLQGRVVLPGGEPVAGAAVGFGGEILVSGAQGQFTLSMESLRGVTVRALHPEHGVGEVTVDDAASSHSSPGGELEVTLTQGVKVMTGRVVSDGGEPVVGAVVRPLDRTPFGVRGRTAGALTGGFVLESVESVLRRPGDGVADADGRFTLTLVAGRSYRLAAFDPGSLRTGWSPPLDAAAAGATVAILGSAGEQSSADEAAIRGRVVSAQNEAAIAGASVQLSVVVGAIDGAPDSALGSLLGSGRCVFEGPLVRTGAAGDFEFAVLEMRPDLRLTAFAGARFGSITISPEPGGPIEFRLPALTSIRLRSDAADARRATAFTLVSPSTGEAMPLYLMQGDVMFSLRSGEIDAGHSPAYRVEAGEYELVL
ncbi:MAG: RNA polymerase sigma factor, partial [Planctomycetota bacterium]